MRCARGPAPESVSLSPLFGQGYLSVIQGFQARILLPVRAAPRRLRQKRRFHPAFISAEASIVAPGLPPSLCPSRSQKQWLRPRPRLLPRSRHLHAAVPIWLFSNPKVGFRVCLLARNSSDSLLTYFCSPKNARDIGGMSIHSTPERRGQLFCRVLQVPRVPRLC